jgi:hypothetical protein
MKAWREANREKHLATSRAWHETNRAAHLSQMKEWRRKNQDHVKAYKKLRGRATKQIDTK